MSYTYSNDNTSYTSRAFTFSANVISYNATTKVVTLDTPINVSLGYNSNLGDVTSQYNLVGTRQNISTAIQNGGIPTLSTDESGNFTGIFNIPAGVFQIGQRIFRIDNRAIYTLPTSASTYAEATFFSSGLSNKIQRAEFSSSFDSSTNPFVQVNQQGDQLVTTLAVYTPRDPVAQTFQISKDNYPNGAFISSVKLFFARKPTDNIPITVSIVGTLNGSPSGETLDNSTVTLDATKVLVSQNPHYLDSSTYTEFTFPAPVYIKAGTLYGILVQANSPDYQLYIAKQNEIALTSTAKANPTDPEPANATKIGTVPYVGDLFESQNSITWVPDSTADMMFVIDRCVFNKDIERTSIPFQLPKNSLQRKLVGREIQYKLDSNTVPNLVGSFLIPIESHEYNVTTTDFVPTGTSLNYTYQSRYLDGGTETLTSPALVNPGKYGLPNPDNISLYDGKGSRIINPYVNDSFTLYADMTTSDDAVSPVISDDGVSLYNIRYQINNMGIGNNMISLVSGGTGYNANTTYATISSPEYGVPPNLGVTVANGSIINVYVQGGNEGSGYIKTPTITIIDANSTPGTGASVVVSGETSRSGGNGYARYITKPVSLTPQNDSGDLRVFCTAYYPLGSRILVYYKIWNRNDTQTFDSGDWQLMTQVTNVNVYSPTNDDTIELEFAPGINNVANNSVTYTSQNGQTYNIFSKFAIKIVFASSDPTAIPYLEDMRALALPSGTGI